MSLLVKGIGMPDCCNTCPCCQRVLAYRFSGSYCGATGREIVNQGEINENCPLIEVPPHGRLIDADALLNLLNHCMFPSDMVTTTALSMAVNWIKEAPTIIEAERDE